MQPWGQPNWPDEGPDWIGWSNETEGEGGSVQVSTRITFTGEVTSISTETVQRIVSCYVLAHIPDQWMGKACEALTELYQWSKEAEHAKVPTVKTRRLGSPAKIRRSERGEFVVRGD